MAGHSHAKKVRKLKEADAKKRGQIFSKVVRLIEVAVRSGGANPDTNPKLRMAMEVARSYNVPYENIERAIKKASGEIEKQRLEEIVVEAICPNGIAMIIEGITDNKNRAINEVRMVLNQFNCKLADEGAVRWMFEKKGCITINLKDQDERFKNRDAIELLAIDAGAEDLYWEDDELNVYMTIENIESCKKYLEEAGIKIDTITLDWKPKERIEVSEKEKGVFLRLFESLDELDSVQEIYSNLKD